MSNHTTHRRAAAQAHRKAAALTEIRSVIPSRLQAAWDEALDDYRADGMDDAAIFDRINSLLPVAQEARRAV